MANSSFRNTNPLVPIGIIGAVVAAILIGVFAISGETPPDEPTIISEEVDERPAGAGTEPQGAADMEIEGVTPEELEGVEPAAGGAIPAQENMDVEAADMAEEPMDNSNRVTPEGEISIDETGSGGADGEQDTPIRREDTETAPSPANESASDAFLLDEDSVNETPPGPDSELSTTDPEALPPGRDAQVELNPTDCQEIVRDPDNGGADVIPTPSGPNGNIGDCVESAQ